MRWVVAPLVAALLLFGSGFLDALERTTDASGRLLEASAEAPESTATAAREVGSLPDIAELTARQADGLRALADALELSAERVETLDTALGDQLDGLDRVIADLDGIAPLLGCARDRLRGLLRASDEVPGSLGSLTGILRRVIGSQEKSVRHMRSINRKLAALGVAASAQGVEPPEGPGAPPEIDPGAPPPGAPC